MQIEPLRLKDLLLIRPSVFGDSRGFFYESYRRSAYAALGVEFVQDNMAFSKKGVLRGLHFQATPGQGKLVSVIAGQIWDVAVDLRPGSETFGQWEAVELSGENHCQFYIPAGFAHGYCVVSETAHVHYKVTADFNPASERTICWNDPDLAIEWPVQNPVLSDRDRAACGFREMVVV